MTDHLATELSARVRAAVRDIPDFPTPGVLFKDITPLLADSALLRDVVRAMSNVFVNAGVSHVAGIESRGFLFGVPVALALDAAFVPLRKPGKLPYNTIRESYALEYRTDVLEMHVDAFAPGARVLIVDDVLATGGTAAAACRLVESAGGNVVAVSVLLELAFLEGRRQLDTRSVWAATTF